VINPKKNFIIFRTDRLGDFIIHSRPIFELKKKFPNSNITVVCSDLNKKIISNYSFVDSVIVFNKSDNLITKFKTFFEIINKDYFASFVLDGKNFSYLCNIFLRSNNKIALIYKSYKKKFGLNITILKPSKVYNYLFLNKYKIFTSKKSLVYEEILAQKYIDLFTDIIGTKINIFSNYIFESPKNINSTYLDLQKYLSLDDYLLIHFDEKWVDIEDIDSLLKDEIISFQKNNNIKIIITAYYNDYNYFKVLKDNFDYLDFSNITDFSILSKFNKSQILILDNLEIFLFERFLKNSMINISCHSGFVAQVCGANNGKIIDIVNQKDKTWYSCWKPRNTFHKFIYKSSNSNKFSLNKIFSDITSTIKKL